MVVLENICSREWNIFYRLRISTRFCWGGIRVKYDRMSNDNNKFSILRKCHIKTTHQRYNYNWWKTYFQWGLLTISTNQLIHLNSEFHVHTHTMHQQVLRKTTDRQAGTLLKHALILSMYNSSKMLLTFIWTD